MHDEHSFPPNGLSGLFLVFGSACILLGLSHGTPARTFPQSAHFAFEGLRFLYCFTVALPGVLRVTLLSDLDLKPGFTIQITVFVGVWGGL